ncbi:hypothetical protein QFC20_001081 [Naganishia adeliensis]|uniref:Uncharacterized protein n=1 Tax=Naganishia adeliensis TaxID=92952 RepID=A0ACC2WVP2_9TREE|nr:hypothetical protein QFC20_001081 [Naganishia adeliensis]
MSVTYDPSPPRLLNPIPPSRKAIHAFLSRHLHLLVAERQAEIDQTSLLASKCSPKLLEKRGLAIGGLGVSNVSVGLGGKTQIELHLPLAYHNSPLLPPHTFRTGDPARLETNPSNANGSSKKKVKATEGKSGDGENEGVEGVVAKVTSEKITLSVDSNKELELPERLRLDSDEEARRQPFNVNLMKVLFGLQSPSMASLDCLTLEPMDQATEKSPIEWFDTTLNDSQKRAVEFTLRANEAACIHGPPGTGKTFTLVEIIRQLVLVQKKKVLICGASNLAVDNLLARLAPLFPPADVVRLGHPARITQSLLTRTLDYRASRSEDAEIAKDVKDELEGNMRDLAKKKGDKGWVKGRERAKKWDDVRELRKEYRTREAKVVKNVMAGAQIVLSTCHGAGSRQLNNKNFDVCIIDEATQAMEAVCWIPILKCKKLILAGDPLQLPPTILSAKQKSSEVKVKMRPLDFPELRTALNGKAGKSGEATGSSADAGTAIESEAQPKSTTEEETVIKDAETSQSTPNGDDAEKIATESAPIESVVAETRPEDPTTAESITQKAENLAIDGVDTRSDSPSDTNSDDVDEESSPSSDKEKDDMREENVKVKRTKLSPPRTLEMTLFDRLEKMYGAGIKRLLAVQYRMHESIAQFPSKALYSSALISHESVASRRLIDLPTITDKESEDAQDILEPTLVFFDTAGTEMFERLEGDEVDSGVNKTSVGEGSRYNENEAEIVSKWVRQLISHGVPEAEIAIITPYQAQVAHLSALLRDEFPGLVCGSVDGMQGQEREAVVLSLVRSNPEREVGFLAEYRRLNVAMTRAKRQLCIVGDSGTVGKGSAYLKEWMKFLDEHADVRWAGDQV